MMNTYRNQSNMFTNDEERALMTPPELADYLGIGRNLAYQLLKDGTIKGFRIGTQWKVSRQAVDSFIAKKSGF